VSEVTIALKSMPGKATKVFGIKEEAGFVDILLRYHVIQELKFNLSTWIVVDPSVRDVHILPTIVVKVGEGGAPEPSSRICVGVGRDIFKRPVSFVLKQSIAGCHLLKDTDEVPAGLSENLPI